MKKYLLYIILGGLLASSLTACQQDVPNVEQTDEISSSIYLSAGIGNSESTRAPYYPTDGNGVLETPTQEHPLNVSVWASTDNNGKFPHKVDEYGNVYDGSIGNEVAIHTTARFQSAKPQLLGEAIYPTPLENGTIVVNFIGLHPQSRNEASWEVSSDNQDASYTFTGKEDVMFAPMIQGEYGLDYELYPEKVPTFHFYHLLTWLRIEMVADKDETDVRNREKVRDAWGKIESLTITSKNMVTIHNLGTTGYKQQDDNTNKIDKGEFTKEENVSFTNETHLNLYCHNTDNQYPITGKDNDNTVPSEFKGIIPTSVTPAAYVMCAPIVGATQDALGNPVPEYILHIKTEHREMDIPLDLKGDSGNLFTGSTMGRVFNIVLNFKMGDVISVSTEISVGGDADWFTHGTGTGDLTEDDLEQNAGNS